MNMPVFLKAEIDWEWFRKLIWFLKALGSHLKFIIVIKLFYDQAKRATIFKSALSSDLKMVARHIL